MLKFNWVSRKVYRADGRVGRIGYNRRVDKYLLFTASGAVYVVNQDFAVECRHTEERVNHTTGRPPHFPGEKTESRLITIPETMWQKLGDAPSASVAIARMIKNEA